MLVLTYLDIYITLLNFTAKTYNEFEFLISVHLLPGFRGACPPHIPGRSAGGQLYPTYRPGIYGRSTPRSLLKYNWTLSRLKARTMVSNALSCSTNLPPGFRSLELLSFFFSKIADVFFFNRAKQEKCPCCFLASVGRRLLQPRRGGLSSRARHPPQQGGRAQNYPRTGSARPQRHQRQ